MGGGHAGYKLYPCKDGRVALAALEPHFAKTPTEHIGLPRTNMLGMFQPSTQEAVAKWCRRHSRQELSSIGAEHDIPLHVLP